MTKATLLSKIDRSDAFKRLVVFVCHGRRFRTHVIEFQLSVQYNACV